jgi:hypothetical protein
MSGRRTVRIRFESGRFLEMEGHGIVRHLNSIQQLGFVAKWNFLGGHTDVLKLLLPNAGAGAPGHIAISRLSDRAVGHRTGGAGIVEGPSRAAD